MARMKILKGILHWSDKIERIKNKNPALVSKAGFFNKYTKEEIIFLQQQIF